MSHRLIIACGLAMSTCALASHAPAHADPTIDTPRPERVVLRRDEAGSLRLGLIADVQLMTVLAAGEAGEYPEIGALDPIGVALASARVGLVGERGAWRYTLRVDASEALRITAADISERPGATIDRFIDDAFLSWQMRRWAILDIGRFKVPFSRFRQLERTRLTAYAVPIAVDRLAPDRRWGLALHGDLGALSYAVGAYEDLDILELRRPDDPASDPALPTDPSASGRGLLTGYVWWTPRGPSGEDHMATSPSDPWFGLLRPAGGLGVAWRERAGKNRLDVSLAVQLAYRRYAVMAEFMAYSDAEILGAGAALQASVLFTDRSVLYLLGEYDGQLSMWSAGAGAAFFITCDRLNKVGVVGLVRRNTQGGPDRDAVLVQVQAAL